MKVIINRSNISNTCNYVINRNHVVLTCTFVTLEITNVAIHIIVFGHVFACYFEIMLFDLSAGFFQCINIETFNTVILI